MSAFPSFNQRRTIRAFRRTRFASAEEGLQSRKVSKQIAVAKQLSPHLLFGHAEGEDIMVLVLSLDEACGTHQGHLVGTEVLQRTAVDGTVLCRQLILGVHHGVRPERLLLLVPLKVPGAQRHLALQAGLDGQQRLVYAVVAKNLHLLSPGRLVHQWRCGSETLNDAAELEVSLQGFHALELLAALWAARKSFVSPAGGGGHLDADLAVVMATGKNQGIRVKLKADGAAQLKGQLLHWLGLRHDERR